MPQLTADELRILGLVPPGEAPTVVPAAPTQESTGLVPSPGGDGETKRPEPMPEIEYPVLQMPGQARRSPFLPPCEGRDRTTMVEMRRGRDWIQLADAL